MRGAPRSRAWPASTSKRGGFDAVVGNPPYIRQERLSTKSALGCFETAGGVADLYG